MSRVLEWTDPPARDAGAAPTPPSDPRLTTFRMLWQATLRDLLQSLTAGLVQERAALALGRGSAGR